MFILPTTVDIVLMAAMFSGKDPNNAYGYGIQDANAIVTKLLKPDIYTKFTSYKRYFFNVIPSNIDKEKSHRINEFLKTISKKDFYALGQQMTDLNSSMRKLHRAGKPIASTVVDQHKDIYDLCCSCIEKYLKILYGIKKAYDGTPLTFNEIKNRGIYEIKKRQLEKSDHNYELLLRPFSTIIWNADKHSGTLKNPAKKRIEFIANEGKKIKSYSSFIQLTKEICAVTFLLSRYGHAILLKMSKEKPLRLQGMVDKKIKKKIN